MLISLNQDKKKITCNAKQPIQSELLIVAPMSLSDKYVAITLSGSYLLPALITVLYFKENAIVFVSRTYL